MRKRQMVEGVLALMALVAFAVCFIGASMLMNENKTGWILCGLALAITVPVVILTNKGEKA